MNKRVFFLIGAIAILGCHKNGAGTISSNVPGPTPSPTPPPAYRIFVTANMPATFGGAAGADSICNSSSNRPSTAATYKAMLSDGSTRSAGGGVLASQSDWVLKPNTTYYQADGSTVIGTTTANAVFDLTALTNGADAGSPRETFTGMTQTWADATSANCSGWTTTSGNVAVGMSSQANAYLLDIQSTRLCVSSFQIYCVEQ
jgi:hypothetical protein